MLPHPNVSAQSSKYQHFEIDCSGFDTKKFIYKFIFLHCCCCWEVEEIGGDEDDEVAGEDEEDAAAESIAEASFCAANNCESKCWVLFICCSLIPPKPPIFAVVVVEAFNDPWKNADGGIIPPPLG